MPDKFVSATLFIQIRQQNILYRLKNNYNLTHILLKYSTKYINSLRKFKLKLYANQDESLADLKTRSWLCFCVVLYSFIIHDFLIALKIASAETLTVHFNKINIPWSIFTATVIVSFTVFNCFFFFLDKGFDCLHSSKFRSICPFHTCPNAPVPSSSCNSMFLRFISQGSFA